VVTEEQQWSGTKATGCHYITSMTLASVKHNMTKYNCKRSYRRYDKI